jgi:phosphoserine phosphatase RsbU/P
MPLENPRHWLGTCNHGADMKIVIADDDPFFRTLLEVTLRDWGHEVIVVANGLEAKAALETASPPCLAILDWNMPEIEGPDVCRQLREQRPDEAFYLILLTSNSEKAEIILGLAAGANDYITKPFDDGELYARISVGLRMLELQQSLADRIEKLKAANAAVHQLQGLLPICSYCKSIRDDQNYWQRVEHYICSHAEVRFTHGICPSCLETMLRQTTQLVTNGRNSVVVRAEMVPEAMVNPDRA